MQDQSRRHGLNVIANGRSLSSAAPAGAIGRGLIFRSAAPGRCGGPFGVGTLVPRTVVDLRSRSEGRAQDGKAHPLAALPGCTVLNRPAQPSGLRPLGGRIVGLIGLSF